MEEDYEQFFSACFDPVRRAVLLTFADAGLAEEATQEAFARAYRRWPRVVRMDDPRGWVHVVAVNVARRTSARRRLLPWRDREPRSADDPAATATASVTTHALLAHLTQRQRTAVVLRYLADLPYARVADALGCAESTARVTVHQALQRLRTLTTESHDGR